MLLILKCYRLIIFSIIAQIIFPASVVSAQTKATWKAPPASSELKNPFANDKTVTTEGKTLYTANCAPCHGSKGKGNGPAAAALNPKPADHTSKVVQDETDGSLYWKISEGHKPMPQYKTAFSDKQRWALVNFIRTLSTTSKK
ncbi:MAG: c-type cytochrome [Bacteroidota bacterium]|nr:c-type cytochrome [Bacteroidota bacterium]